MAKKITINGKTILPGENVQTRLLVSKLPSGTDIDIRVYVYRALEDGPVLLLMAGMHGDEVNGIETIRRMIRRKMLHPLRGTVIAIPILNIYGFLNFSREVPDGKDVNRSFPGSKSGSLASRVADRFTREILPYIDYGIDFHTGGASISNYPQIRCLMEYPENERMARAFGAPFILNAELRPKSLRKEAFNQGKYIIVYESGESLRLDELGIKQAIQGTGQVLQELGMKEVNQKITPAPSLVCIKSKWIRAKFSGIFRCRVKLGQYVKSGEVYGSLADPYGNTAIRLKSPYNGYIIGLNNMTVVNQGDALLHVGFPEGTEP
ncbi:succinylglutamate desuccinylase/aspartoacylase family protein [Adhaeribacter radiodurans]|uniref:Succinylglutamate desuccinylase/aspartoacylase family protein n=1 Tax=Adhaeribacter radiodurans TaxID=2745197 RepID=A0A7L7L477_9BACT|nr:succinylglutamate desuccinylase/aspartoacylase family protein [Adhaeribacter radiodurans]QMU27618.1 succinylglutamate desuccinylase/aspartoacylase family protein [Adhaeribacter radiodurans]